MKVEGVSFNTDWAASLTFEQFKAHESHHKLSEKQLKEAYDLCLKAEGVSLKKTVAERKSLGKE